MAVVKAMGGERPPVGMSSKRRRVERLRKRLDTETDPRVRQSIEAQSARSIAAWP